jgi:hypothetical protein
MTIKEAIIKCLETSKTMLTTSEIHNNIVENGYYEFGAKNPVAVVYSEIRDLRIKGDTRIKRIKFSGKNYKYYSKKFENEINIDSFELNLVKSTSKNYFKEKDLHILLSTFLKNSNTYSKTIFHEKSRSSRDSHQKWVHPDIIGIQFTSLKSEVNQVFLKAINRLDSFKISSFEIKKEINSDYELKKHYFQAVSNSSWANYGYLVAFEISDTLFEEMERLNQSFGIGVIQLRANPYESKILYHAKHKNLDFKTMDKLCRINNEFENFIKQVELLLTAGERYVQASERELVRFCDGYFENDSEIEKYCVEKKIY